MSRVAIFVDAGYLFAQGSVALTGITQPRSHVKINETAVLAELAAVAKAKCDGIRLLRTYWYDAPLGGGLMSASHSALAMADNVKLRLGARNGQGQQKGVDSLIVTDLIELARNGSICDAILLSGDEDVRIGVQIAQSFGVCVHLLGIHPARGSQSPALRQEADTKTEWDKDLVSKFLTVTAPLATAPPARSSTSSTTAKPKPAAKPAGKADTTDTAKVQAVVLEMIAAMDTTDLVGLEKLLERWQPRTSA